MNEKIIQFGPQKSLFGIATEGNDLSLASSKPAILLLNSGAIHRVGTNRFSVDLSRSLAALGYIVFRFDLPKIGDSLLLDKKSSNHDVVINTVKSAMETLEQHYNVKRFISIGNCSGAMNSHNIAVADNRICACVQIDGYSFPTISYWVNRIATRLRKSLNIKQLLLIAKNIIGNSSKNIIQSTIAAPDITYFKVPSKSIIENDLSLLMERNTKLLYIYTGNANYKYLNQHQEAFRNINFKNNLTTHIFNKADHTFTIIDDRQKLTSLIVSWVQSI